MDNKKKKQEKELEKLSEQEEMERMMLISKADEVVGEQLSIDIDGSIQTEDELKKFALGDIDDPERKYDIYYKGIGKLLKKHLPEGKEYKNARDYIYEEKNTYLTRGHRINEKGIRGADSRMGYIEDAEKILELVTTWIINKGSMVDLYTTFRDLNIHMGYGKPNHE
ncbi:hypothetical protein ACE1MK_02850 [Tenacibaculum maritimum]|uniref:hypothetical protein n=1 Tax=Tenacibaculum maritimum TaxID=107401 RepID=UPI0012E55219|nr:hypothetical protein [Tenacibaculum maritimum]CAA0182836.1 conserved hypothetical protein [Tenacibaculum maritimum]